MTAASNTIECILDFRGAKVVGVLQGALPIGREDLARGTTTLIFDDGRGFTFSDNGAFWAESPHDVRRALDVERRHLERNAAALDAVLRAAGEMPK